MRKRQKALLWTIVMSLSLAGCSNMGDEALRRMQEQENEEGLLQEMSGAVGSILGAEPELAKVCIRGSVVVEDETAIYVCGNAQISRMDKLEGETVVLWQGNSWEGPVAAYSNGNALLIGDRIYFMEKRREEQECKYALSTIRTDGTDYIRLEEFSGPVFLFYTDGMVYVDTDTYQHNDFTFEGAWQLQEDGELVKTAAVEIPAEYWKIESVPTAYTIPESLCNYGYYLLKKKEEIVGWNPKTGEETTVLPRGSELQALNKTHFLSERDNCLYLTDAHTLETVFLTECEEDVKILAMDEEYLFTEKTAKGEDVCIYERISLTDASKTELFRENMISGYEEWSLLRSPSAFMPVVVQGGYLYHAGYREDKLYLMRRDLAAPATEQILGESYYDRRVSPIGRLEICHEKTYDETETDALLVEAYLEKLEVDEKFPGAEKINHTLQEELEHSKAEYGDLTDMAKADIRQFHENGYTWKYAYSLSSKVEISYSDTERYLSFYQSDYVDVGGAHGMPYRTGYTFDLLTGKRLTLSDIIDNDSEELKDLLTTYFTEYKGDGWGFWEDALERVQAQSGFDLDFYLTREGICFYFPPYELGGFVLGFVEVVIPYDEWELKIPLGETSDKCEPTVVSQLDYNSFQRRMTEEEWEAFSQYFPVLKEGASFEMTYYGAGTKLNRKGEPAGEDEWGAAYRYTPREVLDIRGWAGRYSIDGIDEMKIKEVSVFDLDGDGVLELILQWTPVGDFLILHREGERFHGFWSMCRGFEMLQTNGVFVGSSGAGSNSWHRLKFEDGNWVMEKLAEEDWGKYWLKGEAVEENTFLEQIKAYETGDVRAYKPKKRVER